MNNHSTNLIGKGIGLSVLESKSIDPSTTKILSAKEKNEKWVWNIQVKEGVERYLLVALKGDTDCVAAFLLPTDAAQKRKTVCFKLGSRSWLKDYLAYQSFELVGDLFRDSGSQSSQSESAQ